MDFSRDGERQVIRAANDFGVENDLALALAFVESNWNPWHVRAEPKPRSYCAEIFADLNDLTEKSEEALQALRWGIMGVPGWVAREMGYKGPLQGLCGLENGARYGCKALAYFLDEMTHREAWAVSAYSVGKSFVVNKKMPNEAFVLRVLERIKHLRIR